MVSVSIALDWNPHRQQQKNGTGLLAMPSRGSLGEYTNVLILLPSPTSNTTAAIIAAEAANVNVSKGVLGTTYWKKHDTKESFIVVI